MTAAQDRVSILLVTSHSIGAKVHRIETVITQALCALKTKTLWQSATAVQMEPSCRLVCNYNRGCTVNEEGCLPQRKESVDSRFEQRDTRRGQHGSARMRV